MRSWIIALFGLGFCAVLASGCNKRTTMPPNTGAVKDITWKRGDKGGTQKLPKPLPPPKWDPKSGQ